MDIKENIRIFGYDTTFKMVQAMVEGLASARCHRLWFKADESTRNIEAFSNKQFNQLELKYIHKIKTNGN